MASYARQHYFLLAILLAACVLMYLMLSPFLAPVVLGIVFAVVLRPVYKAIRRRVGGNETIAALLTLLVTMVVILLPTAIIGTQLFNEAQQLYGSAASGQTQQMLQDWIIRMGPSLDHYVPGTQERLFNVLSSVDEYTRQALVWLIQHLGVAFSGFAAVVLDLFLFFVTLYYMLRDGDQLRHYVIRLSPLDDADDETILDRLELAVNSVVRGKLAIAVIQGAFVGVGFAIFGVPNPVLWGLVGAIVSLIPPLGTGLVVAPAILYMLLMGSIPGAIGLAVWGVVAGVIDNMIGPKLMGSGLQMHPLLVLLTVLGGLAFFGPVGVFIGPIIASLFIALLALYSYLTSDERKGKLL